MTTGRSYAAGHFSLAIDGHATTSYLKSVDGGAERGQVVDDPTGSNQHRVKHLATVEIEPFSIEMGLTGGREVLKWIQGSMNRKFSRRNGEITHANFDLF
jgi:hypothetical protein